MVKLSTLKTGDKFKFRLSTVYVVHEQKESKTSYRHLITDSPGKAHYTVDSNTMVETVK